MQDIRENSSQIFKRFPTICICGYSGSGKTTLIEKLIEKLVQSGYKPGFLKHAGHPHSFDSPTKDTYRQTKAGAKLSMIFSENSWSAHGSDINSVIPALLSERFDILIIEGFAQTQIDAPKILLHHESKHAPEVSGKICDVFPSLPNEEDLDTPAFCRDNIDGIYKFLIEYLTSTKIKSVPLNGVILIGGQSVRMGEDKFLINYRNEPEYLRLFKIFSDLPCINNVFLSGRKEQFQQISNEVPKENHIYDDYLNKGPIGGILTSLEKLENEAAFVIGCDYPNFNEGITKFLCDKRQPLKPATIFSNSEGYFETTCAIYEPSIIYHIHNLILRMRLPTNQLFGTLPVEIVDSKNWQNKLLNINYKAEKDSFLQGGNEKND